MNKTARTIFIIGALASQIVGISDLTLAQAKLAAPRDARAKAQQAAKLVALHVTGSKDVTDTDVAAYTGLKIGEITGPEQFREAADKLAACGAFDEVQYKYEPAGSGYSVTFSVIDSQQLVPATFDNFVWFTDAELTEQVRKAVPLFHGAVPTGGEMLQQVTDALLELISARGVNGTVRFEPEGASDEASQEDKATSGMFTIDGVEFKVRDLEFPGVDASDLSKLDKVKQAIRETPYHKKAVRELAESSIRPIYSERGFLKVAIGEVSAQLIGSDPKAPEIAVSIPVKTGARYSLAAVRWTAVKSLSTEELERLVTVNIGAPVNAAQLQADLDRVKAAYGRKGYIRAELQSRPSFNDAEHTVAYDVQVREGDVYRLKSVDLDGLDAATMARLREEWKLREGEPFDTGYEREYLEAIRPMLAPNISVSVDKDLDDEAKTVEIGMRFTIHADKVIREKKH